MRPDYGGELWYMPLYAYWDPVISWWALLAGVVAAGVVLLILRGARRGKPWVLGAGALIGFTSVNLAPVYNRNLPFNWVTRFLDDTRYIYRLPDIFSAYPGFAKFLHCKCRTRPGMTYWLLGGLDRIFDGNKYAIAFIFVGVAAMCIPMVYLVARKYLNRERSLWAAALFASAPALLVFGSGPDGL